ncbi:MAG TPA: TadE family protein [Burkholderiaceae bacterium]|jgi:hypothetical protein|nr:TadE family protein [Burkholderiaceae bacterium]
MSRSERSAGSQRGGSAVEFALVAWLLLAVILATLDFAQLFFANLTMQHAVREGVRYAITGRTDLAPDPVGTPQDRCDAAVARMRQAAAGWFDRMRSEVVFKTVAADGSVVTIGPGSCYAAGQILVIQLDNRAPVFTPFLRPLFADGVYEFSVSAVMKNEAY